MRQSKAEDTLGCVHISSRLRWRRLRVTRGMRVGSTRVYDDSHSEIGEGSEGRRFYSVADLVDCE